MRRRGIGLSEHAGSHQNDPQNAEGDHNDHPHIFLFHNVEPPWRYFSFDGP
jgi:hypothetical protein